MSSIERQLQAAVQRNKIEARHLTYRYMIILGEFPWHETRTTSSHTTVKSHHEQWCSRTVIHTTFFESAMSLNHGRTTGTPLLTSPAFLSVCRRGSTCLLPAPTPPRLSSRRSHTSGVGTASHDAVRSPHSDTFWLVPSSIGTRFRATVYNCA
ncbi:hypothetical protein Micbo1qcDRAFT_168184 [Microdochium bolleyi]|uniref:Uncharacterized protein n=1 Tax=Microdochium bolleyi TaxID=196109 RepID=A0A136IP58_9PEZI|nr:hypothetical protein Micbo1qcDRAFT_168184 [Microdochium bolleyi]